MEVTMEEEVASGKDGLPRRPGASPFWAIFKCSDSVDTMLMAVGTIGCMMDGASTPLIMLALSQVMNMYAATSSFMLRDIDQNALNLVYIAVGVGLGAFFEGLCWARTAERQASRMRREYLNAILSQDVGFLDTRNGGSMTYQVVSSLSTDTLTIQGVISEKIPNFLMNISTFFTSQLVAFYLCWRLALVMTPALTLLVAPMIVYGKLLAEVMKKIQKSHMAAGGIAEQALSSIRTVFSYVAESYVEQKFSAALELGLKLGVKQGLMKGMAFGTIGIAYALWSLQAWYGSVLVIGNGAKGGDVFNAGVCIIVGGLALGSSLINLKYFSEATVAAASILDIIERVPSINSNDQNGKTMEDLRGELEFKNVDFAYPSRFESVVLRKFNLRVMAGETVGLIGRSGSGKSTIISLIERFYDPIEGEILLDGVCINQLQLNWLRNQISLVNQEPVLFASSIKENIEFGKSETSMEEIVAAAKAANAHDFIVKLPDGYDTHVGQLGTQMSGGQKQRIAITRALLRDPKILLLDEATSALDSHSEKAVQDTLDKASAGRTTIIIAHRLSTLRNVDSIAVLHLGRITEFGPYDQLIQDMHNQSAMAHLQHFSIQKENEENIHQMNTTNASYKSSQLQSPNHEDKKIGEKQDQFSPSLHDLIQTTAPEWKTTLLGCGAAFCYGTIQPMHSFCMGSLLTVYFIDDHSQIRTRTRIYCFIFLAYASLAFITNVIQHYNFVVMGEHISKRVHEAVLKKIFTFEVGWFDQEDNNGGALCSRVTTEVNILRSLVCDRLSLLAQIISAATLATILGFVLAWRLTIVILALQPLIIGSFYGRGVLMKKMSKKVLKAQNKSGELASEAVINHRVITAFSSQEKIMSLFEKTQKEPKKESRKQSWYAGLGLLVSQFLTAANTGLVFWYGGHLLYQGKVTYEHLFQTFFVLVTTGRVIAETGSMTSDLSKGTDAVKSVFMILGRKSKVEPNDPDGIIAEKLIGSIEIKEVSFAYPLRPRQMVLVGLSLTVEAGKTIALVGQSGSGKSTIIGLVERFYDPLKGSIHIDGVDIRRYNLRALREGIGLVSQEPTLFAGSIYENITYGKQSIPEAKVVEAATLANAHEFISGMKDGYQTFCGERGVQLSGGQKQRIALARAILKDPAILLLDEATSALDNISESLIQEAMDKMMVRRTCIVVAHRLSTIQKSDSIAVIENGKVVEEGPHTELLKKGENGVYYSLVRLQQI